MMPTFNISWFRGFWRSRHVLLVIGLFLSGCDTVWFNPYIDLPDRNLDTTYSSSDGFPLLLVSAKHAEALRQTATSHRKHLVVGQSILRYGAFGAATAGGVSALYDAHTDIVLAFGVAAAGTYGAGSLFASADSVETYSAANRALNCVVGASDETMASAKTLGTLTASGASYAENRKELEKLTSTRNIKIVIPNKIKNFVWPEEPYQAARSAISKYDAALDNFKKFKAADPEFSASVRKASHLIVDAMNMRIRDNRASLDTVLQVARGIGAAGAAYVKEVTPPEQDPLIEQTSVETYSDAETKELNRLFARKLARLKSLTKDVDEAADKINETVSAATNRMGEIGSVCVLQLPSAKPLTLAISGEEVTLIKDQTFKLEVRGGKEPILFSWEGTPPKSDQIELRPVTAREVLLIGKSNLATGEFKLRIRDSLADPTKLTVTVKTP